MKNHVTTGNYVKLDELPHRKDGKIDWKKSEGYNVPFVYQNIYGNMELVHYNKTNQTFQVVVDGYTKISYDIVSIDTIKQCRLGRILHKKIIDTNPEMIEYLVDKNDALRYSNQSNVRVNVCCPCCGYTKAQTVCNLYKFGFFCPQCSDGVSYPNKLMFNILKQLDILFINEVTKHNKGFDWVDKYRYDFYFEQDGNKYFIEMDGHFHQKNKMGNSDKILQADRAKDVLAHNHGVKMIRIDCCYNNETNKLHFIKNNILNSELCQLLSLFKVDWNYANKNAMKSNVVIAANLWNDGNSIGSISGKLGVSSDTVRNYLKISAEIGLCNYNKTLAESRRVQSCIDARSKPIIVYNHDGSTNIFANANILSKQSMEMYGRQFNKNSIASSCNNNKPLYGYIVKYITNEDNNFCLYSTNNSKVT